MKKLTEQFSEDAGVGFVSIQTTFEGHSINDASKLKEMADRHQLKIPFGQSAGKSGLPDIMRRYRTGGTPWVVIIDRKGKVRFNDFQISFSKAGATLEALKKE